MDNILIIIFYSGLDFLVSTSANSQENQSEQTILVLCWFEPFQIQTKNALPWSTQKSLVWIYEIPYLNCWLNHEDVSAHHSYEHYLSNSENEGWKIFRIMNPWPVQYRCSTLPTEITSNLQPALICPVSSLGRALQWYCRSYGFNSCTSLNYFQASFSLLFKQCS